MLDYMRALPPEKQDKDTIERYNDAYLLEEARCRHMDTLDHQTIAIQFLSSITSLEFLGLSLHADNNIEHWISLHPQGGAEQDVGISPISWDKAMRHRWEEGMDRFRFQRFFPYG